MLDKLDRIEVTEEQLNKLFIWRDANKDLVRESLAPLREGLIEIKVAETKAQLTVIYFKGEENKIFFVCFIAGKSVMRLVIEKSHIAGKWVEVDRLVVEDDYMKHVSNHERGELGMAEDIIGTYFALMAYIVNYEPQVVIKTEVLQKSKKPRHGKKGSARIVNINRKRYIFNSVPEPTAEQKRNYERRLDSWSVRGFYRHYKSGKKTWIEPKEHQARTKTKSQESKPRTYKLGTDL